MDIGRLDASVYPAVQNFCVAARALGIGTSLTTVIRIHAAETLAALGVPANDDGSPRYEIAACIPLGRPAGNFGVAPRKPASRGHPLEHLRRTPPRLSAARPRMTGPACVGSFDQRVVGHSLVEVAYQLAPLAQVLEVGIGLALGHLAPRSFAEQHAHERGDGAVRQIVHGVADDVEPLLVVLDDVFGSSAEVDERMAVRRQCDRDVA